MTLRSIKGIKNLKGKRVLLRLDLDLPIGDDGKVDPGEDRRLIASMPTIKWLLKKEAKIVIVGHMGRPGGQVVDELKLRPIVEQLVKLLNIKTGISEEKLGSFDSYTFITNKQRGGMSSERGGQEVHVLENIRFLPGEKLKAKPLIKDLVSLADIYINDAFANSHRDHASMSAVACKLPCYAGLNLIKEVEVLSKVLRRPSRPLTLIIGGVKAETKLKLVEKFIPRADYILLGSAIANNFYQRLGFKIGQSKYDDSLDKYVDSILERPQYRIFDEEVEGMLLNPEIIRVLKTNIFKELRKRVILPVDVVVASFDYVKEGKAKQTISTIKIDPHNQKMIPENLAILDIGPLTSKLYAEIIKRSKTIIWNGPMGYFERKPFDKGTYEIAKAVASTRGKGIVGGGDTIAAIESEHVTLRQNMFVSTGGGAMLEFLLDPDLPGIKPLIIRE